MYGHLFFLIRQKWDIPIGKTILAQMPGVGMVSYLPYSRQGRLTLLLTIWLADQACILEGLSTRRSV